VNVEKTVVAKSKGYYEEKKSEFFSILAPFHSIDELNDYISTLRKKHPGMCHFCSAVRLRNPILTEKASDDGEPNGTAGRPILQALQRANLMNCGIVVYRKFGGTKLGTGGLVRAYQTVAFDAIEHATVGEMVEFSVFGFSLNYTDWAKTEGLIRDFDSNPEVEYTDSVSVNMAVHPDDTDRFKSSMTEATSGRIDILDLGSVARFVVENSD